MLCLISSMFWSVLEDQCRKLFCGNICDVLKLVLLYREIYCSGSGFRSCSVLSFFFPHLLFFLMYISCYVIPLISLFSVLHPFVHVYVHVCLCVLLLQVFWSPAQPREKCEEQ